MPRHKDTDEPPPESARIKQSILADYADLVLRIKQARAVIAWHLMRHPEVGELRRALAVIDSVLATDPIGSNSWTGAVAATSPGPFPAEHTHTVGAPPPWQVADVDEGIPPSDPLSDRDLTDREMDVMDGLEAGVGNIEIGRRMNVSPETVKAHLARMSRKMKVHGRQALLAKYRRRGSSDAVE